MVIIFIFRKLSSGADKKPKKFLQKSACSVWPVWPHRKRFLPQSKLFPYKKGAESSGFSRSAPRLFSLSEQVQHIVKVDLFPHLQLVFRFGQIVQQKFQHQRTAKAQPSILNCEKPMGR